MGLYERLMGDEQPKIPVHQFTAAVAEKKRLKITTQQVIDAFGLSAGEQTEVATLFTAVDGVLLTREMVIDVLNLAERKLAGYTTAALVKTRLGV